MSVSDSDLRARHTNVSSIKYEVKYALVLEIRGIIRFRIIIRNSSMAEAYPKFYIEIEKNQ